MSNKVSICEDTNEKEWFVLKKEKGTVYLPLGFLVVGMGIFIILIYPFSMMMGLKLKLLPTILLMCIGVFLISFGFFAIKNEKNRGYVESGCVRFNKNVVELILGNKVAVRIPLDDRVYIEPICNDFLAGYHKLWGISLVRDEKYISIEPNDGFSLEEIRDKIPLLLEYAKKKGAKFHKYWKHIKY